MFDIREDSDDELMHNLMEHSTCTLDISDDESRTNGKEDKGKENIPPFDHGPATVAPITTSVPASRKNLMTDEPRTPLGDLDASEFYAEGCDVNSYVLIPAEKQIEVNVPTEPECKQDPGSLHPVTDSGSESEGWKQLLAQFKAAKKSTATPVDVSYVPTLEEIPAEEPAEIDIWESESAKAENEAASQGAELNTLSCVSNDELIGQI